MARIVFAILMVAIAPMLAFGTTDVGKPIKVITDGDIGPFNYWSADTVYNLSGFCFVEDGEVLVIEPGVVVKSNAGTGEDATALIIARGGKIYAEGTPCDPIIFTSISDVVDYPDDIPFDEFGRGLWGGLILLGKAELPGTDTAQGIIRTSNIEGIPETELRAEYGGTDDFDNSGVLKYVSVRHGGSQLLAANEINGITFGAVGSGTVVSYVEVIFNLDDGFEWFGGTVSCDHLVAAFVGDDCFDVDEGYRGIGQFWFAIHSSDNGDRSGEHDGTWGSELGTCPRASVVVSNATYIGRGAIQVGTQRCFELRDNMSGAYYNSLFTDHGTYGLKVEDDPAGSSLDNLKNGNLKFHNNVWYGFGDGNTSLEISNSVTDVDNIVFHDFDPCAYWLGPGPCPYGGNQDNHNYLSTTDVVSATGTRLPDGSLDPRATNEGSWACNDNSDVWSWTDPFDADDFVGYHVDVSDPDGCLDDEHYLPFEVVNYAGAFDPSASRTWAHEWTAIDFYGYLFAGGAVTDCDCATDDEGAKPIKVVTDADIDVFNYWSSDTVYNLDGFVFVEGGETLLIEPGTIIKGNPGQGENASALIVARDGLIYALGSRCCPVIFTSISDVVDYDDDIEFGEFARGLWGGVIVLGNAVICDSLTGNIEGLPETDPRTIYGGTDDFDNSGVLKYVSIRHGGSQLLEANEINGLTMGAVGCGTIISHVEVFYNLDDGFEWFGGSVTCDHLIAAFAGDDAFDYDECYRGGGQFWFTIAEDSTGDRSGEHDGGYGSDVAACPVGTPLMSNVTYIGRGKAQVGSQRCFEIRDAAGGAYYNSVFTEHGTYGIATEEKPTEDIDSYTRLKMQQLKFYNNVWYGFGNGNASADITNSINAVDSILFYTHDQSAYESSLPSALINNQNYLANNAVIRCVDKGQNNSLDPRPYQVAARTFTNDAVSPWTAWADPLNPNEEIGYHPDRVTDPFCGIDTPCWYDMVETDYPGAFDPNVSLAESWVAGWSFMWCGDIMGDSDPCMDESETCCVYVGDINHDGALGGVPDIADLIYLVTFMFQNGPCDAMCDDDDTPGCNSGTVADLQETDVNGDGTLIPDIADLVYLVTYMFQNGSEPVGWIDYNTPACQ